MTIVERVAWLHRDASTLATNDMVELKHSLKRLITDASETLEAVKVEIEGQRSRTGWPFIGPAAG